MSLLKLTLNSMFGRMAIAGAVITATFAAVSVHQAAATTDGWVSTSAVLGSKPARTVRIQQPRPESAPTAPDGYAVELTGTIEFSPIPRQPRPLSAAPRWYGDQGAL
ncbi:MAG: hypothetical protein U0941_23490 [Planctomycetaceae bacterium]